MAYGLYPVVVMEDRYSGVYSAGRWLAIANASEMLDSDHTRAQYCLISEDGPSGDDVTAAEFWGEAPDWITVGNSPEEAVKNLEAGIRPHRERKLTIRIFEE